MRLSMCWVRSSESCRWGAAFLAAVVALPMAARASSDVPSDGQQLKAMSLEDLGNVKVTTVTKQPEEVWSTAAAVSVITAEDIRRSGVSSIPELLRLVPGVEVARTQGTAWAVAIRGFNSSFSKDILVLIDGRSVYTPLYEGVYWDVQDLPLNEIERIEVIRGPGGTIWGANAVNGVINIVTKKAADTQGAMGQAMAGGTVQHFTGTAGYGFKLSDKAQGRVWVKGFDHGPEMDPNNDPYDDARQVRGGFRLDWQPTHADGVTGSGMIYGGRTGFQYATAVLVPPSSLSVDTQQVVSGGDFLLHWDHRQAAGSSLYVQAYFDRTNRGSPQFSERRDTFDVEVNEHIAPLRFQDIVLGAEIRESPATVGHVQAPLGIVNPEFNNYVYSFFGQDALKLIPEKLTLTLGSKFIYDAYSGWGVEPSAELLWRPKTRLTVWGSVHRALRTPGRLDRDVFTTVYEGLASKGLPLFVQLVGNANFHPEVLIGWSAGFRQLLFQKVYVDVTGFHNQYDAIEGVGGPNRSLTMLTAPYPHLLLSEPYVNGLRGVTDGVEIAPDWKPFAWFEMRGNFSHLHMNLHSLPGYGLSSASITEATPHRTASVQGIFTLPHGWEVVPDYRFVSRLPAENVPSYQTADLRVAYRIRDHLEASATGRNLLQPQHTEFLGNNNNAVGIRREVYGGLSWFW